MLMLALAALASCGGSSGPGVAHDAKPNIFDNDGPTSQTDAGQPDTPLTAGDTQANPDGGGISQYQPYDGGSSDLWMDPNLIFPCTGTPQEISDCIINLPTSAGIPVTRPDPMDFSTCKP